MALVDLVYKVGINSEWDYFNELKYSIRSAQKHFKDLRNIIIVGFKPNFLNDKIIHIPTNDPYTRNKDANLINKMILASLDERTSDEFINISDDQYFLSDVTYDDFKINYIENAHMNFSPNQKTTRWQERLKRTRQILESRSLPYNCYEAHIPYMLNKKLYPKILLSYDYGVDLGYCGNTLYFNTLLDKPMAITSNILLRLTTATSIEQIQQKAVNCRFLNYTYKVIDNNLKSFLSTKFNEKSDFEL